MFPSFVGISSVATSIRFGTKPACVSAWVLWVTLEYMPLQIPFTEPASVDPAAIITRDSGTQFWGLDIGAVVGRLR